MLAWLIILWDMDTSASTLLCSTLYTLYLLSYESARTHLLILQRRRMTSAHSSMWPFAQVDYSWTLLTKFIPWIVHCNSSGQTSVGHCRAEAMRSNAPKYESTSASQKVGTKAPCLLISKAIPGELVKEGDVPAAPVEPISACIPLWNSGSSWCSLTALLASISSNNNELTH